jgi:hypothetical protein
MQPDFNAKAQRCKGAKVETEIEFRRNEALFSVTGRGGNPNQYFLRLCDLASLR